MFSRSICSFLCFFEWSHFSYFLVSSNHISLFCVLPRGNSSSVTPVLLAFYLSTNFCIFLSAGVAREVEQCQKAGNDSQTAGGAASGNRGS